MKSKRALNLISHRSPQSIWDKRGWQGETIEECITHAQEAIALYLEDLVASGEPVPEEKEHPQLLQVTVAA